MSSSALLDIAAIFGAIVGVWFALVGWKLLPLARSHPLDPLNAGDSANAAHGQ